MTTRRSFLGSLLGLVAGKEFLAASPSEIIYPKTKLEKMKTFVKVFSDQINILERYKMYVVLYDGTKILMPDRLEIQRELDDLHVRFQAKDVDLKQEISFHSIGVLNIENYVVREKSLNIGVTLTIGDKLTATYDFIANGPWES